jgi:hypothetical protein
MASPYEKIIKKITDSFSESMAPLKIMVQNQEIIIIQNKKVIELLDALSGKLGSETQPCDPPLDE